MGKETLFITSKLGMFLGCKLYKLGGREDNIWEWLVVYILHFFHQECVVQMGNPILPTVAKIVKRMSPKNINYCVWTGLKLCCVFEVPRLSTTNGKTICRKPGSRSS